MWCCCGPSNLSPIQYLVLLLLNKKPIHGYELFKTINEQFGEKWELNPGAIYKTLAKLVEKGYIEKGRVENGKTVYEPTEKGSEALAECIEWAVDWMDFTKSCCPSCYKIDFKFETKNRKKGS